jgi:hypothetical protein
MNEINRLWDKWVGDHDNADVDFIIDYYRKQIGSYEAGAKPRRAEAEQVDMNKILSNIKSRKGAPEVKPKPVTAGKLRRL